MMMYDEDLGYEDNITKNVLTFFDDHIDELEELITDCHSFDDFFMSGEFNAHFVDPLLDDLEVEQACQILQDSWRLTQDAALWKGEHDPDTVRIIKAAYTYGDNLHELATDIFEDIRESYDEFVAMKGCEGGKSSIFMKAYNAVKKTYPSF